MTDVVVAPGPSHHARVAVTAGCESNTLLWGNHRLIKLDDRTVVTVVHNTLADAPHYVGVLHGFPGTERASHTVSAAVVAGFATIKISPNTAHTWAVGSRVYCKAGTQETKDVFATGDVLVGFVVPSPPRAKLAEHDYLDIIIARRA